MAVWFTRWLRCADTMPIAVGIIMTIANDVTPTHPRRDNV
jgi:hypothetical protein